MEGLEEVLFMLTLADMSKELSEDKENDYKINVMARNVLDAKNKGESHEVITTVLESYIGRVNSQMEEETEEGKYIENIFRKSADKILGDIGTKRE